LVDPAGAYTLSYFAAAIFLILLGVSAGLFDVPLASYMQDRSPPEHRGSILAASNFLTSVFLRETASQKCLAKVSPFARIFAKIEMLNMKIGYARVSTLEQNLDLQLRALEKAGCKKIFREKVSGSNRERPQFQRMLDQIRVGDTIVVWKLDRLARSTLFIAGAVLVARIR